MFSFASRNVLARPHKTASCATPGMLPFPLIAPFAHADNASVNMVPPAVTVNAKSDSAGASNTVAPTLDPDLSASIETITRDQSVNRNAVNSEDALKYLPNPAVLALTEKQGDHAMYRIDGDKHRIDDLVGEPVAALNAARDQICLLNRSIAEADELQRQLSSAQNSYERKRVHAQCESRFNIGNPTAILRECRWKLAMATKNAMKMEQRIHSIVNRESMNVEHVVFDGNNFCFEQDRCIGLAALIPAVKTIAQKYAVTVIFDSSIRYHLKKSNGEIKGLFPKGVGVNIIPMRTKADETVLTIARNAGYYVLSNNRFANYRDMSAVHDNRILRHQILDGRAMIFDLYVDVELDRTLVPGP